MVKAYDTTNNKLYLRLLLMLVRVVQKPTKNMQNRTILLHCSHYNCCIIMSLLKLLYHILFPIFFALFMKNSTPLAPPLAKEIHPWYEGYYECTSSCISQYYYLEVEIELYHEAFIIMSSELLCPVSLLYYLLLSQSQLTQHKDLFQLRS